MIGRLNTCRKCGGEAVLDYEYRCVKNNKMVRLYYYRCRRCPQRAEYAFLSRDAEQIWNDFNRTE